MLRFYEKLTGMSWTLTAPFLEAWSRLEGQEGMWTGRLGHVPDMVAATGPYDVWMHAVSVGEVAVAEALVDAMESRTAGLKVLVSATTPAGFARAMSSLGDRCAIIPYPIDFPQVVRRVVRVVRPRVYASLETELWPNLIRAVEGLGGRTALLNGRISVQSFPRYLRLRPLIQPLLRGFSHISAISRVHAERLIALGAPEDKVEVSGNAKFEHLLTRPNPSRLDSLRRRLALEGDSKVFVAGSIRGDEGDVLIEAFERLKGKRPDAMLILVPRHLKRVPGLQKRLNQRGISHQLWSAVEIEGRRDASVVLVDMMGPLFDLYGLASVAFVGGSLVPKGGQNLMEPAAWGCPVLFGPHTGNFEEARAALRTHGGGLEVHGVEDLTQAVESLMGDAERRDALGTAARQSLESLAGGAAGRQADILLGLLEKGASARVEL